MIMIKHNKIYFKDITNTIKKQTNINQYYIILTTTNKHYNYNLHHVYHNIIIIKKFNHYHHIILTAITINNQINLHHINKYKQNKIIINKNFVNI